MQRTSSSIVFNATTLAGGNRNTQMAAGNDFVF